MSEPLFKKCVLITDLHFGRSGNSPVANQDNLDFLDWVIDEARTWGAETCIMAGDWHDNRHSLGVLTIAASLQGLDKVSAAFERNYFIPGNHDLPYRDKRDAASIEFGRNYPNITIFREPITVGEVTFLPWLIGEESKSLKDVRGRYVVGHLEVPGFLMNAKVEMPDGPHAVKPDQFGGVEHVFTGHFHMRQTKGRITYVGNIMPFNFSDAWDEARGAMFLEWGKDPEFRSWPGQPVYRTAKMSELVAEPERFLCPKATLRVSLDMDLGYEEAQEVRDALAAEYGARKIEIVNANREDAASETSDASLTYLSVDQIVVDGLKAVDSAGLSTDRLVDIYRSVASV